MSKKLSITISLPGMDKGDDDVKGQSADDDVDDYRESSRSEQSEVSGNGSSGASNNPSPRFSEACSVAGGTALSSDEIDDNDSDRSADNSEQSAKALDAIWCYACRYWYFHVGWHGNKDFDKRLSELLKLFLGSMDASWPAYRAWFRSHRPCWATSVREPDHSFDEVFVDEFEPPTISSFAICRFGFYEVLSE